MTPRSMSLALVGLATAGLAGTATAGTIEISEIRIDQPGTDNDEYFELRGSAGASLDGLTYLVIGDGATGSGTIEAVVSLTGLTLDANGYFVAAEDTFSLGTADLVANLNFENSDNVTHVLAADFTGTDGDDLDTDDDGVLDILPWSAVIDAIGLVEEPNPPSFTEYSYGAALGFEDLGPDNVFVPGHAFRCETENVWSIGDFAQGVDDTPNGDNQICDFDGDDDGVPDDDDNCPGLFNPNQHDCDEDGVGDLCEIADGSQVDLNGNAIPDDCEQGLLINEIGHDPAEDYNGDGAIDAGDDEFVEIVNTTGADIDISGWVIWDGALLDRHVFPDGTIVAADCAIVVFGGGTPLGLYGGAAVQVASSGSLSLNNGGETVQLRDDLLQLVAEYNYGPEGVADETLTRDPDVTGANPMVAHSAATGSGGATYSPGTRVDGSAFGGCPEPIDSDGDLVPDNNDNCPDHPNPDQLDCDGDGAGDVCEIADGTEEDCNENGVPDSCEIADGSAGDCNVNGVPDECDLEDGTLNDDNGNGVPDECEIEPPANLVINEIRIDQSGTDTDEYIELKGDPFTSLEGIYYVVIGDGAGDDGTIELVIDLTGNFIPADGIFLIGEDTITLASTFDVDLLLEGSDLLENGDNVTHCLVANFFGSLADDIDTDDNGTVDNQPWTHTVDAVGLLEEVNPPSGTEYAYGLALGFVDVGPNGTFVPAHVYRCDADWLIGTFDIMDPDAADTPALPNDCDGGGDCPADIDGSGEVDFGDLLEVLSNWGPCPGCPADIDGSGDVGFGDLLEVLSNWGPCP